MGKDWGVNGRAAEAASRKAALRSERSQRCLQEQERLAQIEWSLGARDTTKQLLAEQKRLAKLAERRERDELLRREEGAICCARAPAAQSLLPEPAPRPERHPERRAAAAFAKFELEEMPRIKEENPGLRLSQLRVRLHAEWKRSPQNPLSREAAASAE